MLTHTVISHAGRFHVVYPTPGAEVMTSVCDAPTIVSAQIEADRLNRAQVQMEEALQEERRLCGMWRMAFDA